MKLCINLSRKYNNLKTKMSKFLRNKKSSTTLTIPISWSTEYLHNFHTQHHLLISLQTISTKVVNFDAAAAFSCIISTLF